MRRDNWRISVWCCEWSRLAAPNRRAVKALGRPLHVNNGGSQPAPAQLQNSNYALVRESVQFQSHCDGCRENLGRNPLPSYFVYTSEHWRQRADEMRVLAKNVDGDEAQETMLRMAQHYDRLAAKADERAATPQAISPTHAGSASGLHGGSMLQRDGARPLALQPFKSSPNN